MKFFKIIFCFLLIFCNIQICFATNTEILNEQKSMLNISNFTKQAEEYTKEAFPDLNINELLNSAISGNINTNIIYKAVISLLGKEVVSTIRTLGTVLAIIIIHSILKSISDGLENSSISQIVYFVQYLLIVTLIMSNFATVIELTKITIENLIGFSNSLLPILITLIITTRKYCNCKHYATYNTIFNTVYRKHCISNNFTMHNGSNSFRNNFKYIRQSTNRKAFKIL